MTGTIVWALLTGLVTGAAWVGIVWIRREHHRLEGEPGERARLDRRLDDLDDMARRLAEVEERLEFTERLLARVEHEGLQPPASRRGAETED